MDTRRPRTHEELRDFVDTAPVGMHWVAADGTILWANPADYEPLGFDADEYVGRNIAEFHADRDVLADLLGRLGRGERITDYPALLRCKDGSLKQVAITSSVLFDDQGRFLHTRCLTRLVPTAGEEHHAGALRGATDALRLLIDNVQDYAIFLLDRCGHIETWNPGAARIKGYQPDEIVGQHFSIFYPPEDIEANRPQRLLARAAEEGRVEDEGWRVRKDGSRFWANVIITALRDDRGKLYGFGKVTRDLTARRAMEEQKRRLAEEQAARRAAEAAEARIRFLADVGAALSRSVDYTTTLRKVAELVVPRLADWSTVFALDDDGVFRRCAVIVGDPAKAELAREYERKFPPERHRAGRHLDVVRTGKSVLVPVVERRLVESAAQSEEHLRLLDGLGVRSCMMVPLTYREEVIGVLNLMRSEPGNEYDAGDLLLAEDVASRAALAIENARLFREQDKARRDAQSQRDRLYEVLRQTPAVINFLRGPELTFEFVHPRALEETGGRNLVGRPLVGALPEFRDAPFVELLSKVYTTGEPVSGREAPARHRNGAGGVDESYWNFAYLPTRDAHGNIDGVMTFEVEVTDQVLARNRVERMVQEQRRITTELERALRIRDDFLAIAGHELRTPLTAMLMHIESLRRLANRPLDAARLVERLAKAAAAGVRLQTLVNQLLDVSRIQAGRLSLDRRPTDLVALVREVASRQSEQTPMVEIRMNAEVGELTGVWDPERLDQVLTNLLSNAVKYGEGKPVEISVRRRGHEAVLEVADHGIGISPAAQERIFERFERAAASSDYGGIGLGLWIVRQIVEASGGRVEVKSQPSRGSTFIVSMPIGTELEVPRVVQ